jgi:hypothetical protein
LKYVLFLIQAVLVFNDFLTKFLDHGYPVNDSNRRPGGLAGKLPAQPGQPHGFFISSDGNGSHPPDMAGSPTPLITSRLHDAGKETPFHRMLRH